MSIFSTSLAPLLVLATLSAAHAAPPEQGDTAGPPAMRAWRDPVTGALTNRRPLGEPRPALKRIEKENVRVLRRDDGSMQAHLGEQYKILIEATRNPDGSLSEHCLQRHPDASPPTKGGHDDER